MKGGAQKILEEHEPDSALLAPVFALYCPVGCIRRLCIKQVVPMPNRYVLYWKCANEPETIAVEHVAWAGTSAF